MNAIHGGGAPVPVGSYCWESYLINLRSKRQPFISIQIDKEIESQGENWEPFKSGLFNMPWTSFLKLKREADENIKIEIKRHFPQLDIMSIHRI